jgi:hypothetical protein
MQQELALPESVCRVYLHCPNLTSFYLIVSHFLYLKSNTLLNVHLGNRRVDVLAAGFRIFTGPINLELWVDQFVGKGSG